MNSSKEVVLFFNQEVKFNNDEIINEITSRYPELGEALVTPIINKVSTPIISFRSNENFKVSVGISFVSFLITEYYYEKISEITFDFVDIFEEKNIITKGIGYVSSNYYSSDKLPVIKNYYLNGENIGEVDELNLAWYKKIMINKYIVNAWEKIITNTRSFDGVLMQYDINTAVENEIEFDMKFIKKFYKEADKFMGGRVKLDDKKNS